MIEVTHLRHRDLAAVTELFNQATAHLPYHWALDPKSFRQLVLFHDAASEAELAVDPQGWLVATVDDHTVGFAHCAVGRLLSDDRHARYGFLRHLAILGGRSAPSASTAEPAATALLAASEAYFRRQGVSTVLAFPIRGGYPCHLAGRGVLVGDNLAVMGALGRAGYRMSQRWLLYELLFSQHVVEHLPQMPSLNLRIETTSPDGFSLVASDRSDVVADLACVLLPDLSAHTGIATASLQTLCVGEAHRRRGVGRWLLLRCLNELATRGVQRLVVDINHANAAMQALLQHVGLEELPLTGYSFEKTLG